ncbi:MAG: hypothetical protein IPH48_15335 [bacterium]|nr:hypothetical protein [bacterium]
MAASVPAGRSRAENGTSNENGLAIWFQPGCSVIAKSPVRGVVVPVTAISALLAEISQKPLPGCTGVAFSRYALAVGFHVK